jgi:small subunit ribosomal protein S17
MSETENTEQETPAAERPVRDSGPGEGAPGEPGGAQRPSAKRTGGGGPGEPGGAQRPSAKRTGGGGPGEPGGSPGTTEPPKSVSDSGPEVGASGEPNSLDAGAPAEKKKRKRLPRAERHKHSKPERERPAERKPITRLPKPESERGRRQERRGVVVSNAMDKTIVVKVDTIKAHPRYKKVVRRSTKFHAHDPQNQAHIGDVVRIVETRPLSKTKNWRLAEVVEAAR